MSYYLSELFYIRRLQVNQIISHNIVFQVPQIDSQVISRKEILPIRTYTQRINIVIVTVFIVLALRTFTSLTNDLTLWENN